MFLREVAHRHTNKQTNAGHYITSLAEVIILYWQSLRVARRKVDFKTKLKPCIIEHFKNDNEERKPVFLSRLEFESKQYMCRIIRVANRPNK